jgi:hypothetical protein
MVDFQRTDELAGQGMTADTVLETALGVVRHREQQHGTKSLVLTRIAQFWSSYTGVPLDASDAAAMMILLKIARMQYGEVNPDDYVDAAGYSALAGELRGAA